MHFLKENPSLEENPSHLFVPYSPEQLYQPFLQVLLGSIQVIQVSEHLLVILLPVYHLLGEFAAILLDFCHGFFKFLLGPGKEAVSFPDYPLRPASNVPPG